MRPFHPSHQQALLAPSGQQQYDDKKPLLLVEQQQQQQHGWGPLLQPPVSYNNSSSNHHNRRLSGNDYHRQQQQQQHHHHVNQANYSSHDNNIHSNFSSQNSAFKLVNYSSTKQFHQDYKVLLIPPEKQRPFNLLHQTTMGLKSVYTSIKHKTNLSQVIDLNKSISSSSLNLSGIGVSGGVNSDEFPMNYFTDNDGEGSILLPQHKHVRKWPLLFRRFKFISLLGQGRFSKVVLCEDLFQPRKVAIKIMNQKSNEIGIQESVHYFNIQNNNSNNSNNNILRLHLTFYFCGHFCLVFEELGESLLSYIQRFQPFTMTMKILKKLAFQLITGLIALKQYETIHTDLKPENILMIPNSSKLKIADFGNAINFNDKYHLNLNVGRQLQTLFYRSPEVVFGNSSIDFQMDMWSIGCILVECYIGNPLFNCNNLNDLIYQMINLLGPLPLNLFKSNLPNIYENSNKSSYSFTKKHLKLSKLMKLRSNDYQFVSFITSILEYDPVKRLTPEKALLHPFLNSVFPFSLNMIHSIASANSIQPTVPLNNETSSEDEIESMHSNRQQQVIFTDNHQMIQPVQQQQPIIPLSNPPHAHIVLKQQPIPNQLSNHSSPQSKHQLIYNESSPYQSSPKKIKLTPNSLSISNVTHSSQPSSSTPISLNSGSFITPPSPQILPQSVTTLPPNIVNNQQTIPSSIPKKVLPLAVPKRHVCEKCGSQLVELSHSPTHFTIRCKTCRHVFIKNK